MAEALLDLEHLDRYVAGDPVLRDEVLTIFEDQAESWLRVLDPAADDQAWRDAAHSLKGAARGVGAWGIGDICQDAERLIGEGRDQDARLAVVDALRRSVREVVAEVRRLRDLS